MNPHSEFHNPRSVDILLVEDNADHVELITRALLTNNVLNEVHVVNNGEEALDFLYQWRDLGNVSRLGLILLDIMMPKMDGVEVLRRIKADPRLKRIPVVMLTTSAGEQTMIESYNLGANSYVVKPLDFQQFMNVVKQLKLYWLVTNGLPKGRAP